MNLLIAIMNATMQEVQDRKLLYWKFVRAGFWIRFFDDNRALPPPYNLFNLCAYLKTFLTHKLRPQLLSQDSVEERQEEDTRSKDIELTKDLLHRYASERFNIKTKEREPEVIN